MLPTPATTHVPWRGRAGCRRPRPCWHRWRGDNRGTHALTLVRDFTPKTVAQDILHVPSYLSFLSPFLRLLCYDGTHGHTGPVQEQEETGWTLSQWWIKRLPSCASGAA